MANVLINEDTMTDIADAIRSKKGVATTYLPSEMPSAIESISGGGITPTGTINITANGTHDVAQYASAQVNVPNSYASSDEGKVVSNGALVAQTSDTVTQNGTVDTTLIKSLLVDVPTGGGGSSLPMAKFTLTSSVSNGYDFINAVKNATGWDNFIVFNTTATITGSYKLYIMHNGRYRSDIANTQEALRDNGSIAWAGVPSSSVPAQIGETFTVFDISGVMDL